MHSGKLYLAEKTSDPKIRSSSPKFNFELKMHMQLTTIPNNLTCLSFHIWKIPGNAQIHIANVSKLIQKIHLANEQHRYDHCLFLQCSRTRVPVSVNLRVRLTPAEAYSIIADNKTSEVGRKIVTEERVSRTGGPWWIRASCKALTRKRSLNLALSRWKRTRGITLRSRWCLRPGRGGLTIQWGWECLWRSRAIT